MNLYEKIMTLYPDLQDKDFITTIHLHNEISKNGTTDYAEMRVQGTTTCLGFLVRPD